MRPISLFAKNSLAFSIVFLLFQQTLFAEHIVGGDMKYECLGNNKYKISLYLYRDQFSKGATLDPVARLTIYRASTNAIQSQIGMSLLSLDTVKIDIGNPCLVPPDKVGVQRGIYELVVNLPVINGGYYIAYQRCCRNETITNIQTPGDVGITLLLDITQFALQTCNNSPVFKELPPVVICAGADVNYDHSASDAEGDSLTYEFVAPFVGGGKSNDINTPTSTSPDPATPKPYTTVFYQSGYTAIQPMGGTPPVVINPITGRISGIPRELGQYVVGILVREFRNGVLLSALRRDFQFNVATCDPVVNADIKETEKLGDKNFMVQSCGNLSVNFVNESTGQFLDKYLWSFNIRGVTQNFTTKDVSITFPEKGIYQGLLVLNPGTACNDTAFIQVNVSPEKVKASFANEANLCNVGLIPFQFTGEGDISQFYWQFGDGTIVTTENPEHQYTATGNYTVKLYVQDDRFCRDSASQTIAYFPIPPLELDYDLEGECVPLTARFINDNPLFDTTYTFQWDFGDGGTSNAISPTHKYQNAGEYQPKVSVLSKSGCSTKDSLINKILVKAVPTADFYFKPNQPTLYQSTVNFVNQSKDAVRYWWQFGKVGYTSILENPTFEFKDTGSHHVTLIAFGDNACKDTIIKNVFIEPASEYYLPNVFSPNGDGNNELFQGKGTFGGIQQFSMRVYNRWGELIFTTNNPQEGWSGSKNNSGGILANGIYNYIVSFKKPSGAMRELKGSVMLLR